MPIEQNKPNHKTHNTALHSQFMILSNFKLTNIEQIKIYNLKIVYVLFNVFNDSCVLVLKYHI